MKRVGIVTMHKVVNYGSALQAWATQEVIRRLGYDVLIIDYVYPMPFTLRTKREILQEVCYNGVFIFVKVFHGRKKENTLKSFGMIILILRKHILV